MVEIKLPSTSILPPTTSSTSIASTSIPKLQVVEAKEEEEKNNLPNLTAPRTAGAYLDDDTESTTKFNLKSLGGKVGGEGGEYEEEGEEEEEEDEEYWNSEEEQDHWVEQSLKGGLNEVMDQDWDVVSGDFTKRYNRMRQHVVATHAALPRFSALSISSDPSISAGNIVPASNRKAAAHNGTNSTTNSTTSGGGGGNATGVHLNKVSDQLANYSKYATRIDLAPLYPTSATTTRKGGSQITLIKDKSDRATSEQVLDPRTRLIVFKMIGRGLIERVDGCVSTGKEANVYHAISPEQVHLALKIYKTSILVFKDRDRYVSGEFRFKSGYSRSNPRKMVRLWAEKEMRNLRRMKSAGMRVPEAFEVRENVLVMEFMGEDEWQASPRLKDAVIPVEKERDLYIEMLVILRTIFTRCKLVHADFSEYNVLYHAEHLWVIDVSQSVEQDHPAAFDFLRSDIRNADDFFSKRGLDTLGLTRTFNYITKEFKLPAGEVGTGGGGGGGRIESDEEMRIEAERLLELVELEGGINESDDSEIEVDPTAVPSKLTLSPSLPTTTTQTTKSSKKPTDLEEAIFAQSYIPRFLDQVYDPERDVARVLRGEGDSLIYADITGVASIHSKSTAGGGGEGEVRFQDGHLFVPPVGTGGEGGLEDVREEEGEGEQGSDSDSDEQDGEGGSGSGSGSESDEKRPRGKKHEDRDEKKKRRNETKEKAREKRSGKMSKGEKERRVRKTSGKSK